MVECAVDEQAEMAEPVTANDILGAHSSCTGAATPGLGAVKPRLVREHTCPPKAMPFGSCENPTPVHWKLLFTPEG